jgi:structural maintenance of chromosome 3 (chondroitin sulfate proteoglycan 6)
MKKSEESIHRLIESLDKKKDAAIETTFKDVAKNFEEIFAKLVPAGRGRLIMIKKAVDRVSRKTCDGVMSSCDR